LFMTNTHGGGGGIRTHGDLRLTRFPSVPIRPLSHPSRNYERRLSPTDQWLLSDIVTARFCRVRWRSGPVQRTPENQVRVGRQQPSSETFECRRPPGRHFSRRRQTRINYLRAIRIASLVGIGGTPNDALRITRSTREKPTLNNASSNLLSDHTLNESV